MIKDRKLAHIGIATNNVEAAAKWYEEELGFARLGKFETPDGIQICFVGNTAVTYEIFQESFPDQEGLCGKTDHVAFDSECIEADYEYCCEKGYTFITNGVEMISTIWENGVKYFKILSASGEVVEYMQRL